MRWSSIFVTFTLKKIIDWNISFQTVSCIHLMNVDVYDWFLLPLTVIVFAFFSFELVA